MKRRSIIDDMLSTLDEDLDGLVDQVPALAPVAKKIREVTGADRRKPRLSKKAKAKLSHSQIAAGARGAFGRGVQKLREEFEPKLKGAPLAPEPKKRKRKMGPDRE